MLLEVRMDRLIPHIHNIIEVCTVLFFLLSFFSWRYFYSPLAGFSLLAYEVS